MPDDGKSSQFDTYLPQKISILTRDMFAVSYLCLKDKYYYAATCRSTQQVFFRTDRRRATDFPICCCVCNHYKIVLRHAAFISMLLKAFFKMTRLNYLFYSSLAKVKKCRKIKREMYPSSGREKKNVFSFENS